MEKSLKEKYLNFNYVNDTSLKHYYCAFIKLTLKKTKTVKIIPVLTTVLKRIDKKYDRYHNKLDTLYHRVGLKFIH